MLREALKLYLLQTPNRRRFLPTLKSNLKPKKVSPLRDRVNHSKLVDLKHLVASEMPKAKPPLLRRKSHPLLPLLVALRRPLESEWKAKRMKSMIKMELFQSKELVSKFQVPRRSHQVLLKAKQ